MFGGIKSEGLLIMALLVSTWTLLFKVFHWFFLKFQIQPQCWQYISLFPLYVISDLQKQTAILCRRYRMSSWISIIKCLVVSQASDFLIELLASFGKIVAPSLLLLSNKCRYHIYACNIVFCIIHFFFRNPPNEPLCSLGQGNFYSQSTPITLILSYIKTPGKVTFQRNWLLLKFQCLWS